MALVESHRVALLNRLGGVILALVGVLLVEVLLEEWLVTVSGDWPKTLKSALYVTLFVLTIVKISVDRRWRAFTSKADIALVVLAGVLVLAGVVGGSPPVLIGEALFVYLRGAIVFYALRAVRPSWEQVTPYVWVLGGLVVLNCLLAIVQFVAGTPAYSGLGWVDLTWAQQGRAQGLLNHPNHLGHVTGLALAGLVAWGVAFAKVPRWWWALLVLLAVALGLAQSRHSTLAILGAIVIIAVITIARRRPWKRLIAVGIVIGALSALPVVVSGGSRDELAVRMKGLLNAVGVDVQERDRSCALDAACEERDGEVRVLFIKQGLRLVRERPVLGYGVGQFGGIVAVKHDPEWNKDPRFVQVLGPDGFYMYKFEATSVDVFWLHLLVEAGVLGFIAYLVWMYLVSVPLIGAAWRRAAPLEHQREYTVLLWAVAAVAFAVVIAGWSPSLEDPLFPPLMFAVLGFGWVLLEGRGRENAR